MPENVGDTPNGVTVVVFEGDGTRFGDAEGPTVTEEPPGVMTVTVSLLGTDADG